jgi:hypothetical protein
LRPLRCIVVVLLLSASAAAAPEQPGLVEVVAETLVISPDGTDEVGSERAVLAAGQGGLLRTEATLPGAERVLVELKVRVEAVAPPEDGAPLSSYRLSVDSTARSSPSGNTVLRSGGDLTSPGRPFFYEAYVSETTGVRLVFLLQARPWIEKQDVVPMTPEDPRPVAYRLWISRLTKDGPELLDSPSLASLVGRTASYSLGFVLESPRGEPRREELLVRVQGVELRDGRLTGRLSLEGNLSGRPVEESRTWAIPSGGEAVVDLRLDDRTGRELGFRIVVAAAF